MLIWFVILLLFRGEISAGLEQSEQKQLIVMAAPRAEDKYYSKVYQKILNFQLEYAKKISKYDDVAIYVDAKAYGFFSKRAPSISLIKDPMEDIWMRDYTSIFPDETIQFRYTAAAQGGDQNEADFVQRVFNKFLTKNGAKILKTKYKLDGGNVVYDGASVVVTRRFLQDNNLSYSEGKKVLKRLFKADQIAILPPDDPQGLAHADGMVSFIDRNVLFINQYKGKFRERVMDELKKNLPRVKIVEVPYKTDSRVWDKSMSSACGINLNALVTNKAVYLPTFGNKYDKVALESIRRHTKKEVVPIDASEVCIMGGSARCLTWQIQGALAKKILASAL